MNNNTKKITIESFGTKASVEFPAESTLVETCEHIKYLLVAIGYNYESVNEIINTEDI